MWCNIYFTLGDLYGDGHGICSEFHFSSNFRAEEIDDIYKDACKKIGFDFCKECCNDCEEYYIIGKYARILAKYNIIEFNNIDYSNDSDGQYYVDEDEYIDIFFKICQLENPILVIKRDLNEDLLISLDGAGYGLFSN